MVVVLLVRARVLLRMLLRAVVLGVRTFLVMMLRLRTRRGRGDVRRQERRNQCKTEKTNSHLNPPWNETVIGTPIARENKPSIIARQPLNAFAPQI
jgi:hypothetical protein